MPFTSSADFKDLASSRDAQDRIETESDIVVYVPTGHLPTKLVSRHSDVATGPTQHTRSHKNNITVTVSSKNLIEFLLLKGLKKGNKVRQQVGVPLWIQNDIQFSKGCLKGLIDTDGGIYYHRHQSQGYKCFNIGLCFTNKSVPILIFIQRTLEQLGFTPKLNKKSVNLYREQEVCRYAREIGFSNSYHFGRLKEFFKMKYGEVSRMVRHMPGKHEPRKGFAGSSPVLSA